MFKNPFQVAVAFAVLALIVKLTIFSLGMQHTETGSYITYIYMLVLLSAIFFGIRSNKINTEVPTSFGMDFKSGARTAAFFAIIVGGITYFYYAQIDVDFFEIKKNEQILYMKNGLDETLINKGVEEVIDSYPKEFQFRKYEIAPVFVLELKKLSEENPKVLLVKRKGINKTKEYFYNKISSQEAIFSPLSQANYTLFGLVFMGMFNSLVFAFIMKKFPALK